MDDLQKIAAYQEISKKTGGESICHSAILKCQFGSMEYVLNLTSSHGKYIGDNAQIDARDGKEAFFGYCMKLRGPCKANLSDWFNANQEDLMFDEKYMKMEGSVQKDAGFMVCSV